MNERQVYVVSCFVLSTGQLTRPQHFGNSDSRNRKITKGMGKSCFMVAIECLCLGLTNGTKDSQRNQNDYSMKATLSRVNLGISQGDSSTTAFRACYDSVSMIGAETRFGQDLTPPLGILPCRKGGLCRSSQPERIAYPQRE